MCYLFIPFFLKQVSHAIAVRPLFHYLDVDASGRRSAVDEPGGNPGGRVGFFSAKSQIQKDLFGVLLVQVQQFRHAADTQTFSEPHKVREPGRSTRSHRLGDELVCRLV